MITKARHTIVLLALAHILADRGYAIRLDIDGGSATGDTVGGYDDVNSWSVVALDKVKVTPRIAGKLEVYEEATGVPPSRSDRGEILVDLVKTSAGWKFTDMTIKFGAGFYADSAGAEPTGSLGCFGFGRLPAREGW